MCVATMTLAVGTIGYATANGKKAISRANEARIALHKSMRIMNKI